MRILVAPDKFKGSLGADEVAASIAAGLREVLPEAEITLLPVADGGEGTASVICRAAGDEWHECEVHDPLGRMVRARYGTIANGHTAVMEMSEASGLWRLGPEERDPTKASSLGTGEMLLDAASRGAEEIIIGLGGSATNDGGFGMARALGFRFFDRDDDELIGAVSELSRLARIEVPKDLRLPRIIAAVDVRNPLLGPRGATHVFGPQKGATFDQIAPLENALTRLADIAARDLGAVYRDVSGAGAAGGLGFGLITFCAARLQPGFELVAKCIGLEAAVRAADVVITGEGCLDAQTHEGKAPAGVAKLARAEGKRVFAIVGRVERNEDDRERFDAVLELQQPPLTNEAAMATAATVLRARARDLAREWLC